MGSAISIHTSRYDHLNARWLRIDVSQSSTHASPTWRLCDAYIGSNIRLELMQVGPSFSTGPNYFQSFNVVGPSETKERRPPEEMRNEQQEDEPLVQHIWRNPTCIKRRPGCGTRLHTSIKVSAFI